MRPINRSELNYLKVLERGADAGPWNIAYDADGHSYVRYGVSGEANNRFIAFGRNIIPDLIYTVEKQQEVLDMMVDVFEKYGIGRQHCPGLFDALDALEGKDDK